MAFAEDLTHLDDTETGFAVEATYNGGATPIAGIFDNGYTEALGDMDAAQPTFTTRTASVPSAAFGDTLVVASVSYKVRAVEPDGLGVTVLRLERSA